MRRGAVRRRLLYVSYRRLALPQSRVGLYSPRWRSSGTLLAIVDLIDIGDGNLSSSFLESLHYFLGGEFTAAAEKIRIV
jgi:hypothetical protein